MRLEDRPRSHNVEDRRGQPARAAVPMGIGTVVLLLIALALGADPRAILQALEGTEAPPQTAPAAIDDAASDFVSAVLADTEQTWHDQFRARGGTYQEPRLVLFTGQVASACGWQSAAVGPFYCPADRQVYLDTSFFDQLAHRHGAAGDFAQAYVIAHEVGHHVQNLLGVSAQVAEARARLPEAESNALAVRLELQADCFAGVWGHHAHTERQLLEPGDAEEGLRAAAAIGDDTLQKQARGFVVPESFTHGTSEQRVEWLLRGLERGSIEDCDTFAR